jgi:uncharacterized protein with GYD domain
MWFVRLVKMKSPTSKKSMEWSEEKRKEAEKWGVKFHHTFFTLGRYDVISIIEAPDEKTAMKVSELFNDLATAETLSAVSREEVNSWYK